MIEGNIVRDPSLKSTPSGTPVCTFSVAFNRYFKQELEKEPEVSFFDVETWSKVAETCYSQCRKGRGVRVVGRLKQDRWSDAEGKNHSKVWIVAERVEFKPEKNEGASGYGQNIPPAAAPGTPQYREEVVPTF